MLIKINCNYINTDHIISIEKQNNEDYYYIYMTDNRRTKCYQSELNKILDVMNIKGKRND